MNIKDFKVLLDKRVYMNLEGQWRDLFNRLKWDTVKSALKSVAGLQGRKFRVSFLYLVCYSVAAGNQWWLSDAHCKALHKAFDGE